MREDKGGYVGSPWEIRGCWVSSRESPACRGGHGKWKGPFWDKCFPLFSHQGALLGEGRDHDLRARVGTGVCSQSLWCTHGGGAEPAPRASCPGRGLDVFRLSHEERLPGEEQPEERQEVGAWTTLVLTVKQLLFVKKMTFCS